MNVYVFYPLTLSPCIFGSAISKTMRAEVWTEFHKKFVDAFKRNSETSPKQTDRQVSSGRDKTVNLFRSFKNA